MKISPGQNQGTPAENQSAPANQLKPERASTQTLITNSAQKTEATSETSGGTPLERPTDVTYRQDNNGRVYYSVSDAKSGEEILEVPPKALRDVGQGIEEYLKEEQSKASVHIRLKA
jgi:secreted PhoX family phosphatase